MADSPTRGAFQADIPADAVEEALRSVERIQETAVPPEAPEGAEVAVEPAEGQADVSEREKNLAAQLELSQQKARETMERLKDTHDRICGRRPSSRTTASEPRRSGTRSCATATRSSSRTSSRSWTRWTERWPPLRRRRPKAEP
jgi:hypothetical protein